MMFIACDGDDIGSMIERAVMENNEPVLKRYCDEVSDAVSKLESWFVLAGGHVVFSGGDNILIRIANTIPNDLIISAPLHSGEVSFSVGIGESPREAWMALKYAKTNKPAVVHYLGGKFLLISIKELA